MGRKKQNWFCSQVTWLCRKSQIIDQKNPQKTLKLISNYSKVAGFKVNIQKPTTFLYNSNKQLEFEIKDTISQILAQKNETILRYNSNKICTKFI